MTHSSLSKSTVSPALSAPSLLKPADKVALFAPASHLGEDGHIRYARAVQTLHDWGLEVVNHDAQQLKYFSLAGTDAQRAKAFVDLYSNPEIKALFSTRGGYGCFRMLKHVDHRQLKTAGLKWCTGFSDCTVLLAYLLQELGLKAIHGQCLAPSLKADQHYQLGMDALYAALFKGKYPSFELTCLTKAIATEDCLPLIGGNLTMLCSLIGTKWQLNYSAPHYLFLEDYNEPEYRLDRLFYQWQASGSLNHVKAILLGSFEGCSMAKNFSGLWGESLLNSNIPVYSGMLAGHAHPNYPLLLGHNYGLKHLASGKALLTSA